MRAPSPPDARFWTDWIRLTNAAVAEYTSAFLIRHYPIQYRARPSIERDCSTGSSEMRAGTRSLSQTAGRRNVRCGRQPREHVNAGGTCYGLSLRIQALLGPLLARPQDAIDNAASHVRGKNRKIWRAPTKTASNWRAPIPEPSPIIALDIDFSAWRARWFT
jgi:hypothetical protein